MKPKASEKPEHLVSHRKKMPSPCLRVKGALSAQRLFTYASAPCTAEEKGIVNLGDPSTRMGLWVVAGQLWEVGPERERLPSASKSVHNSSKAFAIWESWERLGNTVLL